MSESPLFIPPYVSASRRAESPAPPGIPPSESEFDVEDESPQVVRPAREGLPAHYRMRAEPHYVEALARPRSEQAVTAPAVPPQARASASPDRALGAAAETLARALDSINTSLAELRGHGRPLRERMLLDLARAEAIRAGWLADALAVLQREPLPALDQVNLNAVVARVADTLGPEQRITGQASSFSWPDAPVTVFGDDRLLTVAVGGMLQALGACVEGRETGIVGVRVTSLREGMTRGVEVAQSGVRMSPAVLSRLFDAEWTDHPAGATGAVFLAAAHRIATLQGGMLDARSMEAGGCRLVLGLPAAD